MEDLSENRKIEIGGKSLEYLDTTRKWAMFFAILGFVFIGLMLVIGITAGSFLNAFTSGMSGMEGFEEIEGMDSARLAGGIASGFMIVFMIILAVVYFFPLFYLLQFSKHTAKAITGLDSNEMELGFKYLKSYWVYMGILVIICIAVYLLILIIGGASLAFLSGLQG